MGNEIKNKLERKALHPLVFLFDFLFHAGRAYFQELQTPAVRPDGRRAKDRVRPVAAIHRRPLREFCAARRKSGGIGSRALQASVDRW